MEALDDDAEADDSEAREAREIDLGSALTARDELDLELEVLGAMKRELVDDKSVRRLEHFIQKRALSVGLQTKGFPKQFLCIPNHR